MQKDRNRVIHFCKRNKAARAGSRCTTRKLLKQSALTIEKKIVYWFQKAHHTIEHTKDLPKEVLVLAENGSTHVY
jgi:hypothetical protein